jgi:hypothetical protein
MTSRVPLTMAACAIGSAVAFARACRRARHAVYRQVGAGADRSGYAEFTKACTTPPPARGGGRGAAGPVVPAVPKGARAGRRRA